MTIDHEPTKKKIRPGAITLAEGEKVILVDYEQEEYALNPDGSLGASLSKQQLNKRVKVKSISASTDLAALAQELVDKCKLIQPSKLGHVQNLLHQMLIREHGDAEVAALPPSPGAAKEAAAEPTAEAPSPRRVSSKTVPSGDDAADTEKRERRRSSKDSKDRPAAAHPPPSEVVPRKSRRDKVSGAPCVEALLMPTVTFPCPVFHAQTCVYVHTPHQPIRQRCGGAVTAGAKGIRRVLAAKYQLGTVGAYRVPW